ncbi:MAG: hypothetical protein LBO81_04895 [Clostridiales Family XIII bacterium]|jgi:hypothetical protein|nr:hypothetical protein [Clostridiales Family XIII bacterium]
MIGGASGLVVGGISSARQGEDRKEGAADGFLNGSIFGAASGGTGSVIAGAAVGTTGILPTLLSSTLGRGTADTLVDTAIDTVQMASTGTLTPGGVGSSLFANAAVEYATGGNAPAGTGRAVKETMGGKSNLNSSKDLRVIGKLEDTAVAKNWKGHDVLNDPNWTLAKNDA